MKSALTPSIDLPEKQVPTSKESHGTPPMEIDHYHVLPYHRTADIRTLRKAQRRAGQGAATAGICRNL